MSPTRRTLELLRASGYVADVCERWLPRVNRRRDLFHAADVIAVRPAAREILLVQCTSRANLSARVRKVRARFEVAAWLKAGGAFECWGWFESSTGRWDVSRIALRPDDVQVDLTPRRGRRARKGERQRELFG